MNYVTLEIKPFIEIEVEFNKSNVTITEEYNNEELIFIFFEDSRSMKEIEILEEKFAKIFNMVIH